jgi:hypothetical protein
MGNVRALDYNEQMDFENEKKGKRGANGQRKQSQIMIEID